MTRTASPTLPSILMFEKIIRKVSKQQRGRFRMQGQVGHGVSGAGLQRPCKSCDDQQNP